MSENSRIVWPDLPDVMPNDPQSEVKKLLYQAKLQAITRDRAAIIRRNSAIQADDLARGQLVYNAYLDVAKRTIDRALARAEFVEKAASIIGGVYGAVLGLSFSLGKDVNRPLPVRGLAPTLFLGLSIVLAMVYAAYFTRPEPVTESPPHILASQRLLQERNTFVKWTSAAAMNRAYWLQAAIISLAWSIALLPVAFLSISDILVWLIVLVGLVSTFLLPRVISLFSHKTTNQKTLE